MIVVVLVLVSVAVEWFRSIASHGPDVPAARAQPFPPDVADSAPGKWIAPPEIAVPVEFQSRPHFCY